jgi:23S rRNA pseudouridine2605 synthase
MERLQKILAHAGIASRRAAEAIIAAGRVTVNGEVVTEMGRQADPAVDRIEVDGKPLPNMQADEASDKLVYIALNKPDGVVTTAKDTHGRLTVLDLLKPPKDESRATEPNGRLKTDDGRPGAYAKSDIPRVYPVGRLDADSTGLLLLTNDGDLTYRLTHPRYGVEKEYMAHVRGRPTGETLQRLRTGIEIDGEVTARARVTETAHVGDTTYLRITIHEGRNRQVRLMCAAVGHHVIDLQRMRFGPIPLGDLKSGAWRYLATHEVHALKKTVGLMR